MPRIKKNKTDDASTRCVGGKKLFENLYGISAEDLSFCACTHTYTSIDTGPININYTGTIYGSTWSSIEEEFRNKLSFGRVQLINIKYNNGTRELTFRME